MAWWLLLGIGVLADLQLPVVDLVPWCAIETYAPMRANPMPKEKSNWKERAIEVLQKDASFLLVNHGASVFFRDFNSPFCWTLRHRGLGNSSSGFWGKALSASQQLFALPETSKAQVAAGELREFLTGMVENWEIM